MEDRPTTIDVGGSETPDSSIVTIVLVFFVRSIQVFYCIVVPVPISIHHSPNIRTPLLLRVVRRLVFRLVLDFVPHSVLYFGFMRFVVRRIICSVCSFCHRSDPPTMFVIIPTNTPQDQHHKRNLICIPRIIVIRGRIITSTSMLFMATSTRTTSRRRGR